MRYVSGNCAIRQHRVLLTSQQGGAHEILAGQGFIEKGICQEFLQFSSERANRKEWG
jgi:hypothetical protein